MKTRIWKWTATQTPNMSKQLKDLKILQYNLRKSKTMVDELFLKEETKEMDIIAIQEPWIRRDIATTAHLDKENFHLLFPEQGVARVCFYVNRRIALSSWHVTTVSGDLATLHITTDIGCIHIHNVYKPHISDLEHQVLEDLHDQIKQLPDDQHIAIGDFNLHHPYWGGDNAREEEEAEELIFAMERLDLDLVLPRGTITYSESGRQTTIDLVWATTKIREHIQQCGIVDTLDVDSDHRPIRTIVQIQSPQESQSPKRSWKKVDAKALVDNIRQDIQESDILQLFQMELLTWEGPNNDNDGGRWDDPQHLDEVTADIIQIIQKGIEISTPLVKHSPYMKHGFTKECKAAQAECKRLKRKMNRTGREEDREAFRMARNFKSNLIKRMRTKSFREYVTKTCESPQKMWRGTKFARDPQPKQATIPAIRGKQGQLITQSEGKAKALLEAFFPPPVQADIDDIGTQPYPPHFNLGPITKWEVSRAITQAASNKAPGPDGIPANILKLTYRELMPVLLKLFQSSLRTGYYPRLLKESTTVVLRKPGKDDYSQPKAYRPIALLNTIGKLLETIIARRMSALAERRDMLPDTHMGGRRLRSTDHACHYLVERIYQAWGQKSVASLLLLDVAGAFDKVSHIRLIDDLKRKGMDTHITQWMGSFLRDRTTQLKTSEHITALQDISVGIPQGSPLSPILFLFYNAQILEQCKREGKRQGVRIFAGGFIDDIAILATGPSTQATCNRLTQVHNEICQEWARKHGAEFAPAKYQLAHLTRRKVFDMDQGLQLPRHTVKPKAAVKYLGLWIDSKLNWTVQCSQLHTRTVKSVGALARLAGTQWGGSYRSLRKIYTAIAIPQITYGCSVWADTQWNRTTISRFESLQAKAARIITGAFKATPKVALDVEAYLLPIKYRVQEAASYSALRIYSSPAYSTTIQTPIDPRKQYRLLSPLQSWITDLNEEYHCEKQALEILTPWIVYPNWIPPPINIQGKDEAVATIRKIEQSGQITLYTDGSGINGAIGASCYSKKLGKEQKLLVGSSKYYTVYTGELHGLRLALQVVLQTILETEPNGTPQKYHIFMDNQAAIRAIQDPTGKPRSGQRLVQESMALLTQIRHHGGKIVLHWVPAHLGIYGNEDADKLAKAGAAISLPSWDPNPKGRTATKVKAAIKKSFRDKWAEDWKVARKGADLRQICSTPTVHTIGRHKGLARAQSSILTQLRTGKIALRSFLFATTLADSPVCNKCNKENQTVEHILFRCPRYRRQRQEWLEWVRNRLQTRMVTLKQLLDIHPKKAIDFIRQIKVLGLREI